MTKTIVFIDPRVNNYQSLIDGLIFPSDVFILDRESDGIAQMATILQGLSGINAIHVISHGSQGALYLGSTVLDSARIASYSVPLASIGSALTDSGDILLYGCNVAQGDIGMQFITSLAQYTRADVAASDDATGVGSDWELEKATGSIEAPVIQGGEMSGRLGVNTVPTFVVGTGLVTTDFGWPASSSAIALQADGRILLVGFGRNSINYDFAVARYSADGSLDRSFDGDGRVLTDFGSDELGQAVAVLPDGKILVEGTISGQLALVRYNSDGSLDKTFDDDGRVQTGFGSNVFSDRGAVLLQSDGKVVVVGTVGDARTGNEDFALSRYNPDGSLDTGFDGDGRVVTDFGGYERSGSGVVQQPDGKLLVAGSTYKPNFPMDFALARYNIDGSVDTSFDGDGKLTTDFGSTNDYAHSVALLSNGKIVVAGSVDGKFALARYNANGGLDTSFDGDGKVTTSFGQYSSAQGLYVISLADGRTLVGGFCYFSDRGEVFALVRYNLDGSLDVSFDGDGKVLTDFVSSSESSLSATVQPDGKLLLAGYARDASNQDNFALARYSADGSLDNTFSSPVNTLDTRPPYSEQASPIVVDGDVHVVDAELFAANNYNGATLTLSRHNGANVQDVFSASSAAILTVLAPGSYFAVDGVTIGRVTTNSAGTLTLTFNANATQSLVDKAMQQIAYANTSDAPPGTVQIDWTFDDGNTGAQGSGGAMSVTGSTTVLITGVNDAPRLATPLVDQSVAPGSAFNYAVPTASFVDPDLDTLIYSLSLSNGTGVPPWLSFNAATKTFSGTPGTMDVGNLDLLVTAKDSAGASVSDIFRLTVAAAPAGQTLTGTSVNDLFTTGQGNDTIDGSGGIDTVTFSGARAAHNISKVGSGFTVSDSSGHDGTDSLQNVERLKFSDGSIALDMGTSQAGGQAALLIGAVLGHNALAAKPELVGAVIDLFDQSYTLQQLSGAVMRLDIWGVLAGGSSNTQIASYLLTTVNSAAPDASTLAAAVTALDSETGAAQGNFLWRLAESVENQTQVGLVGLVTTGLEYLG